MNVTAQHAAVRLERGVPVWSDALDLSRSIRSLIARIRTPTGIDVDSGVKTVYVAAGDANSLTMFAATSAGASPDSRFAAMANRGVRSLLAAVSSEITTTMHADAEPRNAAPL